jgi:hypothetical protein
MFSGVSGIAVSLYYWSDKLAVIGWQLAVGSEKPKQKSLNSKNSL